VTGLGARWLVVLPVWAWFAVAVDLGSNAITHDVTDLLMFASGFGLACLWTLINIATAAPSRTEYGLWLSVPFALVFGAVVYGSEWPVKVRVWLCEAELRGYAERDTAEPPSIASPHRVGLYTVHAVDRYAGVVDLMTRHDVFDVGGITYAPNGIPRRPANPSVIDDDDRPGGYRHLYGPWYRRVIRD
jgi:hypothetical protein